MEVERQEHNADYPMVVTPAPSEETVHSQALQRLWQGRRATRQREGDANEEDEADARLGAVGSCETRCD
jgi:hypothetical protein